MGYAEYDKAKVIKACDDELQYIDNYRNRKKAELVDKQFSKWYNRRSKEEIYQHYVENSKFMSDFDEIDCAFSAREFRINRLLNASRASVGCVISLTFDEFNDIKDSYGNIEI